MASFAQFLGHRVVVQYRVGDVLLPASGRFAADSGRSIFLEQHVEQHGKRSYFRWEIPYQFIHKIEEPPEGLEEPTQVERSPAERDNQQVAAAGAGSSVSTSSSVPLISLPQRPKAV